MKEYKLNGESLNIVSENIEKMKELFPEVICEDQINFDMLEEILTGGGGQNSTSHDPNERYQFTWPGKTEAIRESQKQSNGTLLPCKEKSKNWDTTQNLYIEGDNLEVLKLLQKSYYNKIKMIYIDPPYNTGKDFIYPDDYNDNLKCYLDLTKQIDKKGYKLSTNVESNGRYHSNWLNMIYPRLRLARNLLSEDGAIFISMDENEYANLTKVCNEIFGEDNFICSFIRKSGISPRLDTSNISIENDYILLYSKNIKKIKLNQEKHTSGGSYKLSDSHEEKRGKYKLNKMDRGSINYSKSLDYPIKAPDNSLIYPGGVEKNNGWCWRWSKDKFNWGLENDFIVIKKGKNGWSVYFKQYELVDNNDNPMVRTIPYKNLLTDKYYNEYGNKLLKNLFGDSGYFDYPKPIELIMHLLKIVGTEESLILDFFSGSSTTAHAIMKLNSEDKNNRKFIMVQIPEPTTKKILNQKIEINNICEVAEERIRRAGDKIVKESGNKDLDIGFKVFKLDSSNLTKWNPEIDNLENSLISNADNIISSRTELDLVYEIMLKYGIKLTVPVEKIGVNNNNIYSVGFGSLLVCLDDNITSDLAEDIIKIKENLSSDITRVVFKDNGFRLDSDKTNIKETLRANNIEEFITL